MIIVYKCDNYYRQNPCFFNSDNPEQVIKHQIVCNKAKILITDYIRSNAWAVRIEDERDYRDYFKYQPDEHCFFPDWYCPSDGESRSSDIAHTAMKTIDHLKEEIEFHKSVLLSCKDGK